MKQISYAEYNELKRMAEEPRYVPPNPLVMFAFELFRAVLWLSIGFAVGAGYLA